MFNESKFEVWHRCKVRLRHGITLKNEEDEEIARYWRYFFFSHGIYYITSVNIMAILAWVDNNSIVDKGEKCFLEK